MQFHWMPVVLMVCIAWIALGWFALVQHHEEPGTFGDMFGAANSLLSALAFAALIYTILLQRYELKLQRIELTETRTELKGQREQMEGQSEQMRTDSFENSFFRVLGVFGDIVASIDLIKRESGVVTTSGRDCFGVFYDRLENRYASLRRSGYFEELSDRQIAERAYKHVYTESHGDVGHYFRTLYNLVKLVDRSAVDDKHFYTNLIRAQLSNQETLLLFYNCACGDGRPKFEPLVERYALLKNMPRERLIDQNHIGWFEPSAFGKEFMGSTMDGRVDANEGG
ncbi:putative phage abortive infection protein [Noviluteimonas gilva]|uniref:Phage abortive infection protein n=1 Tax=Noviluteimonas gilva TaxID=2682097 RepID=A0A7C9LYM5_9GAMM|nr:putative phage abortive infection protein [Lysobacter gilvus]MUV15285.1 hypothetical protein [Lysobacter gilvus]